MAKLAGGEGGGEQTVEGTRERQAVWRVLEKGGGELGRARVAGWRRGGELKAERRGWPIREEAGKTRAMRARGGTRGRPEAVGGSLQVLSLVFLAAFFAVVFFTPFDFDVGEVVVAGLASLPVVVGLGVSNHPAALHRLESVKVSICR